MGEGERTRSIGSECILLCNVLREKLEYGSSRGHDVNQLPQIKGSHRRANRGDYEPNWNVSLFQVFSSVC